jgi:hypothetical protein
LATFQGRHREEIFTWVVKFRACKILSPNYAGSNQKSYKITRMKIFAILVKAKPGSGNIRWLISTAVQPATFQTVIIAKVGKLRQKSATSGLN